MRRKRVVNSAEVVQVRNIKNISQSLFVSEHREKKAEVADKKLGARLVSA